MDEHNIPYNLLAKQMSDTCTAAEQAEIARWLNEDPEHQLLLDKLQRQWNAIQIDPSSYVIPDKVAVWERIQTRIQQQVKQVPLYPRSLLIRVVAVAAVVSLLLGLGISYQVTSNRALWQAAQLENTIISPSGQKTEVLLPDGTQVWLNSGSRLSYNATYGTRQRGVKLEGEAFFDVKQNQSHPFLVSVGELDVKVHGTAFSVSAYKEDNTITVALLRGKVSLLATANQELLTYLLPNQIATIAKKSLACRVTPCDAQVETSWHQNQLKFDGAPIQEVWKKLERWYGVDIALSNLDTNRRYWFTVKTESLTELLEMINKITPISYNVNGKEVTVAYK